MSTKQQTPNPEVDPKDLDLVDDRLEDEGKDDAALWAELDQVESGSPDDTDSSPDNTGGEDDDALAAADAGTDDDSAATRDHGSDDAPGDAGEAGKPPADATPPQAQDLWANATPEQRAAYEAAQQDIEKLQQAERSNRGRLSALQRQINELTRKPAAPPAADKGQGDDKATLPEEWKGFQEEYPEVAAPVAKAISALQEQLTRANKELSAIGIERRQTALAEQAQLLAQAHPDWEQIGATPEFVDWVHTQPRHIQEAAYRNADSIVDAAEAADLIGRFKAERGSGSQRTAPATTGQGNSPNNRLSGKRQHQLDSAASARSKGPSVASGIPEDADEETIWRQFDKLEAQQQRA